MAHDREKPILSHRRRARLDIPPTRSRLACIAFESADSNLTLHTLRDLYRAARRGVLMGAPWSRALSRQRAREIALLLLSVDWTRRQRVIVEFRRLLGDEFGSAIRARLFALTHRANAPMRAAGLRLRSGRELRAA